MNGVFICLFGTVIYHCLKQWSTGELDDRVEFKKENRDGKCTVNTSSAPKRLTVPLGVFCRLLNTWRQFKPDAQEKLIELTRRRLRMIMKDTRKDTEDEPTAALQENASEEDFDAFLTATLEASRPQLPTNASKTASGQKQPHLLQQASSITHEQSTALVATTVRRDSEEDIEANRDED